MVSAEQNILRYSGDSRGGAYLRLLFPVSTPDNNQFTALRQNRGY
jgi:hypothetical protein